MLQVRNIYGVEREENAAIIEKLLQGLATGTLLYVVFFEVLEKERKKEKNGLIQVGFIFL